MLEAVTNIAIVIGPGCGLKNSPDHDQTRSDNGFNRVIAMKQPVMVLLTARERGR